MAKLAALHEAETKAIGERVTKTRRELRAEAMGEAVPEALVPAAGNRAVFRAPNRSRPQGWHALSGISGHCPCSTDAHF